MSSTKTIGKQSHVNRFWMRLELTSLLAHFGCLIFQLFQRDSDGIGANTVC